MEVLHELEEKENIRDMQLEEISTEDVIRKIYDGDMAESTEEE